MEIPDFPFSQICEGNVVLFLGAGASKGACDSKGNLPPDGKQLGDRLSDKFLGGKFKELPLSQIADLSISESSLLDTQQFIYDIFVGFNPSSFHNKVCRFWWHGIATTNYDLIIEKVYKPENAPVQNIVPFISDLDRVDDKMKDPKSLMFLKLHGCITRINSPLPLILSVDQYLTCRKGRDKRIYKYLYDWAYEHPIIFIGHSLQDPDLRAILLELDQNVKSKPRSFIVAPEIDDIQKRFWETKRVTTLEGTLEDFLNTLDTRVPAATRAIHVEVSPELPISERFIKKGYHLSIACNQFLQSDVEYVKSIISTSAVNPGNFYRGFDLGWGVIEQQLDVRRELLEVVLLEKFLIDEVEHMPSLEMILIKAPAGSGKTVLLQRLAWEASRDYNKLCIFLRPYGAINTSAVQELITLCDERVFLFVDNAADHLKELLNLANNIKEFGKRLTVVLAERTNEWNMVAESLNPFISYSYNLKYLSEREIQSLISLLVQHHALGVLEHCSSEERTRAFVERAGRQLLVALHEATLGMPFEEIIVDEFNSIIPPQAQQIYLTICVLNRLGVPVRAGIVSRIHNVPFVEFKQKFFAPLEQVVKTVYNPIIRDFEYSARHQHIAEIVFDNILRNRDKKFECYISCLRALNPGYNNDRRAFRQMTAGRTLLELFPDYETVKLIYEIAEEVAGEDAHLLHQKGIYEMRRPNGSLEKSSEYFSQASALFPYDVTIKHSKAELQLKLVDVSRTPLEKEQRLKEATALAISIKNARTGTPYAFHTLTKVGLKRLRDCLNSEQVDSNSIQDITKEIEGYLFDGLQQFPSDPYLCEAESTFASLLEDSDRALKALEKALVANPRNTFIALRLAGYYQRKQDLLKAKDILKKAIEVNESEKKLNYAYAKTLLLTRDAAKGEVTYHLRRAFTEGDTNYDAQLLYGRQLFIEGDQKYKELFKKLSTVRMSFETQIRLLYPLEGIFHGTIAKMESTHCFISMDGFNDWIFTYQDNVPTEVWVQLRQSIRVCFKIAFTIRGPSSFEVSLE